MKNTNFNKIYLEIINEMSYDPYSKTLNNIQDINTADQAFNDLSKIQDTNEAIIFLLQLRIKKAKIADEIRVSIQQTIDALRDTEDQDCIPRWETILNNVYFF